MTKIQQVLQECANYRDGDVHFRNSYSGRMMYGKSCVGITGSFDNCMAVIADTISALAAELFDSDDHEFHKFDDYVSTLMRFRMDSMGLDSIVYWPDLEPLPDENEDG